MLPKTAPTPARIVLPEGPDPELAAAGVGLRGGGVGGPHPGEVDLHPLLVEQACAVIERLVGADSE